MRERCLGAALLVLLLLGAVRCQREGRTDLLAGTESHGTGGMLDRHNPWYLSAKNGGNQAIEFCVEVDPSSKYTAAEYLSMVERAIGLWQDFFKKYGYENRTLGAGTVWPFQFKDGQERRLALAFAKRDRCAGTREELRFLFAPRPPVGESIDGGFSTSLGAAIRGRYDHETFRNGGTVWVHNRPQEGKRVPQRAVMHILLHELGHVFGLRHNETWVMYENAADESFEPRTIIDGAYPIDLGMIELSDWRFRLKPKDVIRFSRLRYPGGTPGDLDANEKRMTELWGALGIPTWRVFESLRFDGVDKDGTKNFTFLLSDHQNRKLAEIPGKFEANELERQFDLPHGPSVFTAFLDAGRAVKMLGAFWDEPDIVPAKGFLETKDGKIFTTELGVRYGMSLRIAIPEKRGWLHFHSEHVPRNGRNDVDGF